MSRTAGSIRPTAWPLFVALALAACPPAAHAGLSANATVASEYVFRGYTQTEENPALQAGAEYATDLGPYLGAWASNVEYGTEQGTELDFIGGWRGKLPGDVGFDVGYIQYTYSSALGIDDIREVYAGLTVGPATVRLWDDLDDADRYYDLEWKLTGADALVDVSVHAGRYKIEPAACPPPGPVFCDFEDLSYTDYRVGLGKTLGHFTLGLQLWSTSDKDDVPAADTRAVISLTWAL